ncbi:MAG: ribosome maturation factor RimM [bacterium]
MIVGRIVKTHGVHGAFRVSPETDYPDRLLTLRAAVLVREDRTMPVELDEVRPLGNDVLMHAREIGTMEEAAQWRGGALAVPREAAAPLPAGHHYVFNVLGMSVETEEGEALGRVAEVLRTGSNDVYLVRGGRGDILIPAIDSVVLRLDDGSGTMVVRLIPGLVDDRQVLSERSEPKERR